MDTKTVTIKSVSDLIAMVPPLLGFHPTDSVVMLCIGSFHARVDLPGLGAHNDQRIVTEMLTDAATRNNVERIALLIYSHDAEAAREMAEALRPMTDTFTLVEWPVRVHDGRHYDALNGDVVGIAINPSTLDLDLPPVLLTRKQLAQTLVGGTDEERAALSTLAAQHVGLMQRDPGAARVAARGIQTVCREGKPLSTEDLARLLGLIQENTLRDVAWACLSRETGASDVEFWSDVVRRTPGDLATPAAGLLAFAAWLAGNGALAWIAHDIVVEHTPDYTMAEMVAQVLTTALSPDLWVPIEESELPIFAPVA